MTGPSSGSSIVQRIFTSCSTPGAKVNAINHPASRLVDICARTASPLCTDDAVHMDDNPQKDDKLLDEYVLADVGKIWMGSYGSAQGRQWVYGQYDDGNSTTSGFPGISHLCSTSVINFSTIRFYRFKRGVVQSKKSSYTPQKNPRKIQKIQGFFFKDLKSVHLIWE